MTNADAATTVYSGRNIRCGFFGGDLLIAVEGGDRFEAGGMFRAIDLRACARAMANDFGALIALIDRVALPAKP